MCTFKMEMLGFTMLGAQAMTLPIEAGVGEAIPAAQAHQVGDGLERLLDLLKSFSLLDTPEAANHGEAGERVEVRERGEPVGAGGELDRAPAQAVPVVYKHLLVQSSCHHHLRHDGHQQLLVILGHRIH